MTKTIFEELGSKYERQGDYLIPCIALPAEEEQPIGIWGGGERVPVALKLRTDRADRRERGIRTIISSTARLHTPIFSQAAG